ncbi:DUF3261 domain-containing protein [Nevskia sp.]|uniref:DUF3261 domain-containing protein n=1 Tax=Nevskia sp. TaxID=1929292 RepID=UPI0025DBBF24|nr:DUF3261 domain-containing protein [Nevskia sp.]
MLIRALLVIGLVLNAGCALLPAAEDRPFPLAELAASLPPSATQTLAASFGSHQLALQCAFAADAAGWRSVCIGPAGRRLLTINVDANRQLTSQLDPALPTAFDPQRMALDIQWAFWPLEALELAAKDTQWRVMQPRPDTRQIHLAHRLIAEIHYADADPWNGRLTIVHHSPAYCLDLLTQAANGR